MTVLDVLSASQMQVQEQEELVMQGGTCPASLSHSSGNQGELGTALIAQGHLLHLAKEPTSWLLLLELMLISPSIPFLALPFLMK